MKKFFISLALALPVLVSCIVDDADVDYIDSGDLTRYTKDRIAETAAIPVEAMEIALELDRYLQLTDEEKKRESYLYGHIEKLSEDSYGITLSSEKEYRNIWCHFMTYGVSIYEKDARWRIVNFSMSGNDFGYSGYDYSFKLPENCELLAVAPDEGYWSIDRSGARTLMILDSINNGLYSWDVIVADSEDTEIGLKAYFGTSGKFNLQETLLETGEKTNLYTGKFFVEIYRGDKDIVDYCYANFNGSSSPVYSTSR